MRLPFLIVVGLFGAVALAGCNGSSVQDAENLQGQWIQDTAERKGDELTVQGDGITVVHAGGSKETVKFKLSASHNPRWIDCTDPSGNTLPGIYDLQGDTLKLCIGKNGPRPTSFSEQSGILLVLKRKK